VLPLLATIFTIIMYILFSTIFHNSAIVGAIGKGIGEGNIELFGYVAYINFLFILFPLYEIYKRPTLLKKKDIYVGWGLLLVSILILQGLIFKDSSGVLSSQLYTALTPNIGKAGLFLIFLLTATLSYTIINRDGIYNIVEILTNNPIANFLKSIKEKLFTVKPQRSKNRLKELKTISSNNKKKEEIEQPKPKKLPKKSRSKKKPTINTAKTETTNLNDKEIIKEENEKLSSNSIIVDELEENAKLLEDIEIGKLEKPKNFKLPSLDFLQTPPKSVRRINEAEIDRKIGELLEKLRLFKIDGDVVRTYTGPLVTTFEFKPAPNVKVSKILGLQDDLAMALSAETIRIQAPIPGRDVVGIEIPNDEFQTIFLKDILESKIFKNSKSPLTVALGKDIVGRPFVTDLQKLPHLLIAGTTGSGKSVGINAMILSLLYRNSPDDLKLILIDPKMLEFSIYNDIPHLLTPVIIEPKKAVIALANLVSEMERRYKLMAQEKVKNIDNYNQKAKKTGLEKLPFIVIIIDELADLMMTAGKEVEYSIGRLAQMARAAGIHIIVATQRPSVDVVTGLIKANLPARLSYRVGQKIDSKVILDAMGADALLGRGDALFTPPGITGLVRLHAPWNTEEEIEDIVEYLSI